METETQLKRPYFNDKMVAELAKIVGKIVQAHHSYNSLDECIDDAKDVLEYNWNDDGFQLAKEFETHGYTGSTLLVDDLDCVNSEAGDILKEAVKKWVKDNDIKLELPIGTKVVFDAWTKNNDEGEIMRVYPETAEYGVWSPSLKKPKGTSHYIIAFEKIKSYKN